MQPLINSTAHFPSLPLRLLTNVPRNRTSSQIAGEIATVTKDSRNGPAAMDDDSPSLTSRICSGEKQTQDQKQYHFTQKRPYQIRIVPAIPEK